MDPEGYIKEAKSKMEKAIIATGHELSGVRTGRATTNILDRVTVDYYGTQTPLSQVANISVPEAQLIVIQPWDKGIIGDIEKAIQQADIGLNPSSDGQIIRLLFPPLSEERRREMAKMAKKYGEEGKVAIRNIRRDVNEHLKLMEKDHDISEDRLEGTKTEVQELTDKFIAKIDVIVTKKEEEIMEV